MLDIPIYILLSALGVLWGFLGATLALKKMLKPEIILDFSDVVLDEITHNIDYQKKIYILGGLLGQGIKSGIGLPKKGGKFKIEDIIGQLIGGFVENMAGNLFQTSEQAPRQETSKMTKTL